MGRGQVCLRGFSSACGIALGGRVDERIPGAVKDPDQVHPATEPKPVITPHVFVTESSAALG